MLLHMAMGSWHVNRSGGGEAFKESLGVGLCPLFKTKDLIS